MGEQGAENTGWKARAPLGGAPLGGAPLGGVGPFLGEGAFLGGYDTVDVHRRNLPHWQQGMVWCFVTWRLWDSLPADKLRQWQEEKADWLRRHPQPWDEETEADYYEYFSHRLDHWLDQGMGCCRLRDRDCALVVRDALLYFAGERYDLFSFVVMPNHVHVMFRLLDGHKMEEVLQSWKGFTAWKINRMLGRRGVLWQDEYWDRLVRSEAHFWRCDGYIRENPVRAGLRAGEYCLHAGITGERVD